MSIPSISSWVGALRIERGGGLAPASHTEAQDASFGDAMVEAVQETNATMRAADDAVHAMTESEGANLHETMVALEKADIALRFTVRMGQKLVQAYQDVSRMQV